MTLKEIREALDISQVELDRRANVTRGTVQDLESGKNTNPSVATADAIVQALRRAGAKGVDIEGLFIGKAVAS